MDQNYLFWTITNKNKQLIKRVITKVFQDALDEATDPWGVKAERVEMSVALLVVVLLIVILIASIINITVLIDRIHQEKIVCSQNRMIDFF